MTYTTILAIVEDNIKAVGIQTVCRETGIARHTMDKILSGKKEIGLRMLLKLCDNLDLDLRIDQ